MGRKPLTQDQFLDRAKKIHNDKYDYSKVKFKNTNSKVIIICPTHGEFKQYGHSHLNGKTCRRCSYEGKKPILTQNQFLEKAKYKHGDRYDYSKVIFNGTRKKIEIVCKIHGIYTQSAASHLSGSGCPKCAIENRKYTKDKFLKRAKEINGDRYDYSEVFLENGWFSRIKIICRKHGEFEQSLENHLKGNQCMKCSHEKRRLGTEEFIKRANKVHPNKYNYSKSVYMTRNDNVEIICYIHGSFWQNPEDHVLQGHGCPDCSKENARLSVKDFLIKANKVHSFKYNYSKTIFKTVRDFIVIVCPKHGEFKQLAQSHLYGKTGCPKCSRSRGEDKILNFLETSSIDYYHNKMFDDFRNTRTGRRLSYDFFLPKYNLLIEFDGRQHFEPVDFGGHGSKIKTFREIQRRDVLKTNYAKENNIDLLRISYYEIENVEKILEKYLGEKING